MYIIVGLGNPTDQYAGTRHNVGFDVIDKLADEYNISVETRKGRAFVGSGMIAGRKVLLVKPQTYMNLSGESVRSLVDFYKIDVESELLVIYDDVSLDVGQLRIRKKGSAGGHNGLKNIVQHLGSGDFARIRVGVGGKPDPGYDLADYVLGHFAGEEKKVMEEAVAKAAEAVICMVTDGVDLAMNRFNTPRQKKKKAPKEPAGAAETGQEPQADKGDSSVE